MKFNKYEVIPITKVEREYNEKSNSEENESIKPLVKKNTIFYGQCNEDKKNHNYKYKTMTSKISHNPDILLYWKYNEKIMSSSFTGGKNIFKCSNNKCSLQTLISKADQVVTKRINRLSPDRENQLGIF